MTTLVTFLLDRSNSMSARKDDTLVAFNGYLAELQKDPAGIFFSLILFDTNGVDTVRRNLAVKDVTQLNAATYQPEKGASTPLIDAACKTIKAVEAAVAKRADEAKVVVCIQTDGEENSSREFTWDNLVDLIKEKTDAGWQFNFMGCSIDAYQQGARMGISVHNTVSYSADRRATASAFAATAQNTSSFARGMSATTGYSDVQKRMSGDVFVAATKANIADALAKTGSTPVEPAKPIVEDIDLS